jgi:hypothetical protein
VSWIRVSNDAKTAGSSVWELGDVGSFDLTNNSEQILQLLPIRGPGQLYEEDDDTPHE